MKEDDRLRRPRPVPVSDAVRDLIRRTAADRPPDPPAPPPRTFHADGEAWTARIAGEASAGTGALGSAILAAIHFARADHPERPLREALLPSGRFERLHDDELAALLRAARPLPLDGARP